MKNGENKNPQISAPNDPERRRTRRWPIVVGVIVLVVVILFLLLPYLVSTHTGSGYLVSYINNELRGSVRFENLSTSWAGPTEATAIELLDPDGRSVMQAGEVRWSRGMWAVLTEPTRFDQLTIHDPQAVLYFDEQGRPSLLDAVEFRREREPGPLPQPVGQLRVQGGNVRMVRPDGQTYQIDSVEGEFEFDTLSDIQGSFEVVVEEGSRIVGNMNVQGLVTNDEFTPEEAQGMMRVQTDGGIDLEPLAIFAFDHAYTEGVAHLQMDATFEEGQANAVFDGRIDRFRSGRADLEQVRPIDLDINGRVQATRERVEALTALSSQAGQIQSSLTYLRAEPHAEMTRENLMGLLLQGEPHRMPEFTLRAEGNIDIPTLGESIPAILTLRPGVRIVEGVLQIEDLQVRGGDQPEASGQVRVTELTAQRDAQTMTFEPMILNVEAGIEEGTGLFIREGDFQSDFARAKFQGTIENMQGTFDADLAGVDRVGEVFEIFTLDMTGRVNGRVRVARVNEERINLTLDMQARQFTYQTEEGTLEVDEGQISYEGYLQLENNRIRRAVADEAQMDLDGNVRATGSGWYDLEQRSLQGQVNLDRGNLGYISNRANAMTERNIDRYDGNMQFQTTIERQSADTPFLLAGDGQIGQFGVDGELLTDRDVLFDFAGVRILPGERIEIEQANVDSDFTIISLRNFLARTGQDMELVGEILARGDIAGTVIAAQPFLDWQDPPAMAGVYNAQGTMQSRQNIISIDGNGDITNFQLGTGPQAFREERMTFSTTSDINQDQRTIAIREFNFASTPLSARMDGTISEYDERRLLNLSGNYEASWERITTALHQISPGTRETIAFTGQSASPFTITGPAASPVFKGIDAGFGINWASGRLFGLTLAQASLSPVIRDGRFDIPDQPIPASDGVLQLAGFIDLLAEDPTLRVPGQVRVLDNVRIDREIGQQLLSRINPIFGHVARLDGRANLDVQDLVLPLSDEIFHAGSGRGYLDLSEVILEPTGFLSYIIRLGMAVQGTHAVRMSGIDFVIENGRLHYRDFHVEFGRDYDMIFSGSVGFDDTLEMFVSLPLRRGLLEEADVRPDILRTFDPLRDLRVTIPITGTRDNPLLELGRINFENILRDALRDTILRPGREVQDLWDFIRPRDPERDEEEQERDDRYLERFLPRLPFGAERRGQLLLQEFVEQINNKETDK